MDSVFRSGIGTPFSPTVFDVLLMGDESVENPIVLDEEEDKENAPKHPNLSDLPNFPDCREVELLEQEWKMYPIMYLDICLNKYCCVCFLV